MFSIHDLPEHVEDEWRLAPFCAQCGEPTVVVERGDRIWIECPTLEGRPGLLRSLLKLDLPILHTRQSIAPVRRAA